MHTEATVRTEDLMPVRSRISWPAILGGSAIALSLYFLMALLGSAVGLSIRDNVSARTMSNSAIVFAIVVTALCLFCGGFVASQLTTGENHVEGGLYGIFVWATVFAILVMMVASGVRMGFGALVGVATAGSAADVRQVDWESAARDARVPQERFDEWKRQIKDSPASAKQAVEDPANQKAAAEAATRVTWYTFFGAWLSMMAAAAGGYFGSGPAFRLMAVSTREPVGRVAMRQA